MKVVIKGQSQGTPCSSSGNVLKERCTVNVDTIQCNRILLDEHKNYCILMSLTIQEFPNQSIYCPWTQIYNE